MLTTPGNIRTLQRKLYRKAKQEPSCRFHALYDKVYRADILSHAYNLVPANRGGAGVDGVTFKDIEAGGGASAFMAELSEALKSKTYKPDPVKRVMIPKGKEWLCAYLAARLERYGFTRCQRQRAGRGRMPPAVKNIGKPCAGKPHARFDEGRLMDESGRLIRSSRVRRGVR